MRNNLLFITRKYPPVVGGMEKYSYELYTYLSKHFNTNLIANRKTQKWFPFFFIYATIKSLLIMHKYDYFYIGDPVLSPLGYLIKILSRKPVFLTVYGLDLTYKNFIYRNINLTLARKLDKIICISKNTKDIALKNGFENSKLKIINIGIDYENFNMDVMSKEKWTKKYNINTNQKILITVGRLVKRKGVNWFIKNILNNPELQNYHYYIIGNGKIKEKIISNIKRFNLKKNITILTNIDDFNRNSFYAHSDLFIMPNIKVKNDLEGFGIVAIEAGAFGLPVFTSAIEGISDAIIPGKTAITYDNTQECINRLKSFLKDTAKLPPKNEIKKVIKKKYDWNNIIKQYVNLINKAYEENKNKLRN